ncbi:unnamed protein product [Linum trigynum]
MAARVGIIGRARVAGCPHGVLCSYGHLNKEMEKNNDINRGRTRSTDNGESSSTSEMLYDDDQYRPDSIGYNGDYKDYYYKRYGDVPSPGVGH